MTHLGVLLCRGDGEECPLASRPSPVNQAESWTSVTPVDFEERCLIFTTAGQAETRAQIEGDMRRCCKSQEISRRFINGRGAFCLND